MAKVLVNIIKLSLGAAGEIFPYEDQEGSVPRARQTSQDAALTVEPDVMEQYSVFRDKVSLS